jgi:signal peptidase II
MTPPRIIEVFPFFNVVEAWNKGVSFSMLDSNSPYAPWLLSALALAIVVFLIWWGKGEPNKKVKMCIAMIVGGALGNVIDRVVYGAVYDFLDFYYGLYHWPAFNIADCGITIGAAIIIAISLFSKDNDVDSINNTSKE